MKKYPIETKTIEELVKKAVEIMNQEVTMSEEEELEDDAEYGYFQDDDD